MSQYSSFFNNLQRNFTFQNNVPSSFILPPPPPPVTPPTSETDDEFIKKFTESLPQVKPKPKINRNKIWKMKVDVIRLLGALYDIKLQEETLSSNYTLSDEEWQSALQNININKKVLKDTIIKISKSGLDISRKLITKRRAKRLHLKRIREERKQERDERIRQNSEIPKKFRKFFKENSRKHDENLQKIKDDIDKAKQEEEAKLRADIVLKEVLRKKHDAKKSIAKLEALVKLRKARENTAKGKGQPVSEIESNAFHDNIERLKSLWMHKLSDYEKEENELRKTLENQNIDNETEVQASNIVKWRKALFGGQSNPQFDFNGDLERFISVRAEWDHYIDDGPESSPIPVGWVYPDKKT